MFSVLSINSKPDPSKHSFQCSCPSLESTVQVLHFLHPSVEVNTKYVKIARPTWRLSLPKQSSAPQHQRIQKKWNLKICLKIHTGHFPSHRLDNTKTKYFIEFSLILTCRGIIWRQGESTTNFFGNTLSSPRLLFPDVRQIKNFSYKLYWKICNKQSYYHLAIAHTWIPGLPYELQCWKLKVIECSKWITINSNCIIRQSLRQTIECS